MTALTWDGIGEHVYETGVDHGVLYMPNEDGVYDNGVAWNGLVTVTETPSGAEANPQFADNIKYLNLYSAEEFAATLEAFTYPPEFDEYDGRAIPSMGVTLGQQPRKAFALSYRTRIGNDLDAQAGYKLHLIYGATASPSEKAYTTVNDSPEAITFSWEINTVPVPVTGYESTSIITIDSTLVNGTQLAALEELLYGGVATDPSLPTPDEVIAIFEGVATATNVVVAGAADAIAISGTTTNVLFTVEAWDGDEFVAVVGGTAVNEVAAEALVLANGVHRVSLTAGSGFYIPAAQVTPFIVTVT